MRYLIAGFVLAACFALTACDPPANPAAPQVQAVVTQVQQTTASACAFVPTAETVAGIFFSGNAAYQTATAIADAVCRAVSNKSVRRGAGPPKVAGVVVKGHSVSRR
jgi:hypothetical protein